MTDKDRDRLIEAAEELKIQRARETCRRAVVLLQGAPGRWMKDRYFIINIPKDVLGDRAMWDNANKYLDSRARFPLFFEMALSLKYLSARVVHFIGDEEIEEIGGGG